MNLSIEDIRLIRRIAQMGSLAAVARESGQSPATLSARLKTAEDRLAVRLFVRTTRTIALTDEGRHFIAASDRLLAEWESLEQALRGQGQGMIGPIRITAPGDTGALHVAPVLAAFQQQYPETVVDLHLSDAVVDLVDGGFDLAIRGGDLPDSRLRVRPLIDSPRLVVGSPAYLQKAGIPQTPTDLAAHQCIARRVGGLVVDEWAFLVNGTPTSVRVRPSLIASDGAQTRRWAVAGAGLALKNWLDIIDDLRENRLQVVLREWALPPVRLNLVSPPRQPEPRRIKVVKEWLVAAFARLGNEPLP